LFFDYTIIYVPNSCLGNLFGRAKDIGGFRCPINHSVFPREKGENGKTHIQRGSPE